MEKPIRVGIVDDHPGVRAAIRDLLTRTKDIIVVGEADNGSDAILLVDQEKLDVLLLDVELPVLRGDEVVQRIRKTKPDIKVLAISSYNDPMYVLGMLENGAAGYIMKEEAPHMLTRAVHSIVKDQVKWISPTVASQISQIMLDNKIFTGRELIILRYIVLDKTDEEIALTLEIDGNLLKRYLKLLMDKFEVSSRKDLKDAAQGVLLTSNP